MSLFHRHRWFVISAAKGKDFLNNYGYEVDGKEWGRPVTRFILQCSGCGDIKEKMLDGHFDGYATLEEVRVASDCKPSKGSEVSP